MVSTIILASSFVVNNKVQHYPDTWIKTINYLSAKEANVDLEKVKSGNVWVVNSYHRAVMIATEA